MTCRFVQPRLSAFLDGDLVPAEARTVSAHLDACDPCRGMSQELQSVTETLGDMPHLAPRVSLAVEILDRLEVERRGPGLALLFRPAWRARPLMLPSLLPAALVLALAVASAVAFNNAPAPEHAAVADADELPPVWGTEANPLFPVAGVSVPRARSDEGVPAHLLTEMAEGTLFVETVVARDGSVSAVHVLEGNSSGAALIVEALRRERFWPGRVNGRPVAVSVYRLISRMDVRPPVT